VLYHFHERNTVSIDQKVASGWLNPDNLRAHFAPLFLGSGLAALHSWNARKSDGLILNAEAIAPSVRSVMLDFVSSRVIIPGLIFALSANSRNPIPRCSRRN